MTAAWFCTSLKEGGKGGKGRRRALEARVGCFLLQFQSGERQPHSSTGSEPQSTLRRAIPPPARNPGVGGSSLWFCEGQGPSSGWAVEQ